MSAAKHTAGPWQVKNEYVPGCLTIIANVDGEIINGATHYTYDFIASCEDEHGEFSLDAVANARLIAAAPDLLASVQELLAPLERASAELARTGKFLNEAGESAFDRARAAICKATSAA